MAGIFNGQFAIFFGKNCLWYKDKSEVEHSGSLSLTEIARKAKEERESWEKKKDEK